MVIRNDTFTAKLHVLRNAPVTRPEAPQLPLWSHLVCLRPRCRLAAFHPGQARGEVTFESFDTWFSVWSTFSPFPAPFPKLSELPGRAARSVWAARVALGAVKVLRVYLLMEIITDAWRKRARGKAGVSVPHYSLSCPCRH